tara:strand:+ start:238 stop:456 length:219 start_codon:yes stop_codon:yes gene_type:complete
MTVTETQYLTTQQLAERYGLSPNTIKSWRAREYGPEYYELPFVAFGTPKIRYQLHKVLAWEEANQITPIKPF